MSDAKRVLSELLKYTGESKNSLSKIIGLPRSQNLYDIESGKVKKISSELSEKITIAFPEINRTWLLTGEGTMLKGPGEQPVISALAEEEQEPFHLKRRRIKSAKSDPFMVPFVPVKAQAGYVRAMDQSMFVDTMEKYAIPPGVDFHGAIWRYWEIEGDSMEPSFHSGDIILTSQVHRMDWEQLRNFYLYVIVTEERVLFKRVYCMNDLEWVLISENEEGYPQQILPAESVKEVWVYRRSIVNKAPVPKMYKITVKSDLK